MPNNVKSAIGLISVRYFMVETPPLDLQVTEIEERENLGSRSYRER